MIRIQGPDGSVVEFPEGTADATIKTVMAKNYPASPSIAGDVAKSAGTGLVKGALNVAGMVPDVAGLLRTGFNKAIDAGAGALGINADPYGVANKPREAFGVNLDRLGTSTQLKQGVESAVGPFYKPQTVAGEFAQTAGEFVPSAMAFPGGAARNAIMGVTSGLGSEAAGQMTKGTAAEPYARIAGAFAGGMVPSALSRVVTPLPMDPARAKMVEALQKEGVPLTAGQRTGSRPLQWAESTLGDMPFAGRRSATMQNQQREAFTAAALRRTGETANAATPEVMAGAYKRIGSQFDDIAGRATVNIDKQFAQELGEKVSTYVENSVKGTRPALPDNIANSLIDFSQNQGGVIKGKQFQNLRMKLNNGIKTATGPELEFYKDVRRSLDDLVGRTAPEGIAREWAQTRGQYRNYKTVEKAVGGAGENAAQGLISPQALRSAVVNNGGKAGYVRGQGDLAELARAGNVAMPQLPNSGTAPRQNMQNMMQLAPALLGGAAGGIPAAAAGILAPSALGRALMSKPGQAYLGNQIMKPGQKNKLIQQLLLSRIPAAESIQGGR